MLSHYVVPSAFVPESAERKESGDEEAEENACPPCADGRIRARNEGAQALVDDLDALGLLSDPDAGGVPSLGTDRCRSVEPSTFGSKRVGAPSGSYLFNLITIVVGHSSSLP